MKLTIEDSKDLIIIVDGETVYLSDSNPPTPEPSPTAPNPTSLAYSTTQKTTDISPPSLINAGAGYRNPYGFSVQKLTNVPTGAQHFYVSPHPINCDGTQLIYTASSGGGMFIQDLVNFGELKQIITRDWVTPTSYHWHPTDPNILFITMGQTLWHYNVNESRFVVVANLSAFPLKAPLFLWTTNGYRFIFTYQQSAKVSVGIVCYNLIDNLTTPYMGTTLINAPTGMNLTGAFATPDMEYIFTQVNGANPSTLTYVCNWGKNPFQDSRLLLDPVPEAPLGIVTGHGCITKDTHHRICGDSQGDGVGYIVPAYPDGRTKYLKAVRSHDVPTGKDTDRFIWHPTGDYGGMHLSGNENNLLLSTYKVGPETTVPDPFNGELILIDSTLEAKLDGSYPQPSTVTNPQVIRIARHFSYDTMYWDQPRASIDPGGREVVFTSRMDGTLQVYRVWLK